MKMSDFYEQCGGFAIMFFTYLGKQNGIHRMHFVNANSYETQEMYTYEWDNLLQYMEQGHHYAVAGRTKPSRKGTVYVAAQYLIQEFDSPREASRFSKIFENEVNTGAWKGMLESNDCKQMYLQWVNDWIERRDVKIAKKFPKALEM